MRDVREMPDLRDVTRAAPGDDGDAPHVLVLGLGNVLCGDDGLGPAAVAQLEREFTLSRRVAACDGGTLGLGLLGLLCDFDDVILVDAVATGGAPGGLCRFEGAELRAVAARQLSSHQVGIADLLEALQLMGRLPRRLTLLGLVPGQIGLGLDWSDEVRARLPELVDALVDELARRGERPPRRTGR